MKRRTPRALSVARKPPPEKASANGGCFGGAGGKADRRWTLHSLMRSFVAVPIAGELSGDSWVMTALVPLMSESTPARARDEKRRYFADASCRLDGRPVPQ